MKTYKITASQTLYATYEVEIKAKNEEQAEKKALSKPLSEWDDESIENADGLSIDQIEEAE